MEEEPPPGTSGIDPPINDKFWKKNSPILSSSSSDEEMQDNTQFRKRKQESGSSPNTVKKKVKKPKNKTKNKGKKANSEPEVHHNNLQKQGFTHEQLREIEKRKELVCQSRQSDQGHNTIATVSNLETDSIKETDDDEGFTVVKTKTQQKRERGSFAAVAPSRPPVRKSTQAVRKQYTYALKTTKLDKKLLSPSAFSSFLNEKLGDANQPDHAQSIGAGTGWILSFNDHNKMSSCLEASKSWQEVDLDVAINKEDSTHPLVVVRVGPHVLEEDFLSVEHVVRAGPIRKSNGDAVNKWKVSFSSKDARDECLQNGFNIGFFHFETESYIIAPRILQCYKCQHYGHTQKHCEAQVETCYKCAKSHRGKDCKVTEPMNFRCAVCRGRHATTSPDCPERIRAREATIDRPYAETLGLRHQGVTTPPRTITHPQLPPPRGQPPQILKPRQQNNATVTDLKDRSQNQTRHQEAKKTAPQSQRKVVPKRDSHLPPTSSWGSKNHISGDLPQMISEIMTKLIEYFNSNDRSSPERIMSLIFSLWPTVKDLLNTMFQKTSETDCSSDLNYD